MTCERMTLAEVVADMRRRGMKIKESTVSDGIASGIFPFGSILGISPTGRRNFLILRRDYEDWVAGGMQATDTEPAPGPEWELFTSHVATQEDADIIWEISVKAWRRR